MSFDDPLGAKSKPTSGRSATHHLGVQDATHDRR